MRECGLRAEPHALEVHVNDLVPELLGHVRQGDHWTDCRIVYQNIEPIPSLKHGGHPVIDRSGFAHIHGE
jgi:hypothetical protein